MRLNTILLALFFFGLLEAQPLPPASTFVFVTSAPAGACTPATLPVRYMVTAGATQGKVYGCVAGTWTVIATPGSVTTPVAVADGGTGLTTAFARSAFVPAAECNNATAAAAYDLPTSNAPAAVCGGTSYRFGALAYDDAAAETATFNFPLPAGWTGAIDFTGYGYINGTSQALKLTVATVCIATSSDILNPTFNSAQTISVTSPGTANQLFTFTQSSMTVTGCSAGNILVVKVGRDVTDTSTGTLNYTGTQLVLRVTPQA